MDEGPFPFEETPRTIPILVLAHVCFAVVPGGVFCCQFADQRYKSA
jgi:hypothetical protein